MQTEVCKENKSFKKVLVVDDNEILTRAWKRMLAQEPCEAFVTDNPEEALDFLEQEGADLLISDIVMPRMDGFELIQKAQKIDRHLKIILTTGYVCDFTRIHLGLESQDLHVLMKPYNDIGKVESFIHRLLEEDESLSSDNGVLTSQEDLRIHLWTL